MAGRRSYSREFKTEAVKRIVEDGVPRRHVARELGVSVNTLSRWKREYEGDPQESFPGHGKQKPQDAELTRLRQENAWLIDQRINTVTRLSLLW
jgi:transposase